MISRYTRPEMAKLWSLKNKYQKWLEIEILVCEAWAEKGVIPKEALAKIKEKASFSVERIAEIETQVKHDVIAFISNVEENIGPEGRYLHLGLTSSDILDTANAVLLKEAMEIILEDVEEVMSILREQAFAYKDTPMIGRSHGVHAEPITFGLKLALWYEEMRRNKKRLQQAKEDISYGKISGAVGTFAHLEPEIEEYVCPKLGLKPAPITNQIIQRDRYAHYFTALAILAGTIEKIALEIRHLQRTEVLEVEEPFTKGQKGSSAMPHKRNPIQCENLCGLARLVRTNAIAALENIALWHERDISHSSVERVIMPDSTILSDFMLHRLKKILANMEVYPERMLKNIYLTKGLIFSQGLLLALVKKGLPRQKAYEMIQDCAMRVWQGEQDLKTQVLSHKEIKVYLTPAEIEKIFDLKYCLRHIDKIFARIF
ncbi:MAG: Adenylosuccinate lyase [Candidatus Methanoperedenaceae archaeon GB50]|nr:MAG: Adenylosuccinate lyase [Candidatus Methanoperedenaceae archaeon GB37]CAD7777708.1 Adenylosuccinate lyase [Candidatus Methanoperedenaceae archaeon GB50]CAD7778175.1 MAG: Adenylosuccinate lyase [Candidatus Methanoperedenaceae archaeon GB50]CAD7778643.1 Adenylosuccinate lyase [Candidatus Methanoperedenaceae archaeon GB37]